MSSGKVLLFILSVFAVIFSLSAVVPEEGFAVGKTLVKYPTSSEILSQMLPTSEPEDAISPEELMENRVKALSSADFMADNPARFHFPADRPNALDDFFSALEKADSVPVHIIHYGDSQLEEDRITGTLRDSLQARFGGYGPGLLPLKKHYTFSVSVLPTSVTRQYAAFGMVAPTRKTGFYGPMGLVCAVDTSLTVSISASSKSKSLSSRFSRVSVLVGRSFYESKISCGQDSRVIPADSETEGIRWINFELPDSSSKARLHVGHGVEVYGLLASSPTGVGVDNVAMRGSAGECFTSIKSSQLSNYYEKAGVKLIILQYGGNIVPFTSKEESISKYARSIDRQLKYLRKAAPQCDILFIGPSDMSTNVRGTMTTYPQLPDIVDSLRAVVNANGAVFWDMYSAMGGQGSMTKWVNSRPALAGSDYVHFTRKGSEKMGGLLYGTMMLYYDNYRSRKEE